jgi:hypothetical protein
MASTINADNGVVSGSSGVKTTADTSGVLALQSNGSTALSISTGLVTTLTNPLPVGSGGTGATSLSGITAGSATNLAGGVAGAVPYQSGVGATGFSAAGSSGQVLTSAGSSVPTWTSQSSLAAGSATNLAGGAASQIPYQTGSGATSFIANGTSGQVLTSNGASAPTWASPAASAGSVTAVASGSLSDGSRVILNSDGTVSVPAVTGQSSFQTTSGAAASGASTFAGYRAVSAIYGATDGIIIIFYQAVSTRYLYAVAGKAINGLIIFGTPTALYSAALSSNINYGLSAAWDAINNRYICLFVLSSSTYQGSFAVCKVNSSLAITNTATYIDYWAGSFPYPINYNLIISPTLNGSYNQALIQYFSNNVGETVYIPCTCSNSAPYLTIGTEYSVNTNSSNAPMTPCFGATSNIGILAYSGNSGRPYISVVTLSGTSGTISNSTQLSTDNCSGNCTAVAYSPTQNKFFYVTGISSGLFGCVFTVSGTTPTIGTPAIIGGFGTGSGKTYSVAAYEATGTFWAGFDQYAAQITVSGTTFTSGSLNAFSYATSTASYYGTFFYNSADYTLVSPAPGTAQYATATAFTTTLTSTNFLGVSNAAYTNGQTATIQTVGSTDDAQSGLTPGLKYYVSPSGTLTTAASNQPYAGLALTATKLVIKG